MKFLDNAAILFCDNHVLVVDKPADIATQPELVEMAKLWVKKEFHKPGSVFLEPIHRLDKPVAGVVIFARTSKALSRLQEEMRGRNIQKIYHAWVEGSPPLEKGVLRHFLEHKEFHAEVSPRGKESILTYEKVEKKPGKTLLKIELQTGRYHQIRAQMQAIGCPILGDKKYGSQVSWSKGIALYATSVSFTHPVTKELHHVKSLQGPLQFERH
ncbi:MAG: RNA pseudouridine synthase [Candidatus Rhabdochlamydia sp.]